MVKKYLERNIEEFKGISERIAVLNIHLPAYKHKWSIIQIYAPTDQYEESTKDRFYDQLSTVLQKTNKNVMTIGDFNGRIGTQRTGEDNVIGKFGFGRRTKNGERMIVMAFENNLAFMNSFFKINTKKKWTWQSPDGSYKNEIDYIATNNRKLFQNVNILSQFNFNTNHRMVRAVLSSTEPKKSRNKYNVENNIIKQQREAKNKIVNDYHKEINEIFGIPQKHYAAEPNTKKAAINLEDDERGDIPDFLQSEIEKAIQSQKNDKTPGPDQITNKMLKIAITIPENLKKLKGMYNTILRTELMPLQWTKSTIILLHKKGDRDNIEYYRPISLMSNIYKIFFKLILNRLKELLDQQQPMEQAGFRAGFSTIDHMHVLKQLIEKCTEYEISGEEFQIAKGVRQGDPLSPKLFSAILESVFRDLEWEKDGINIDGKKLNHLRFADDLVLITDNATTLQHMLQQLTEASRKVEGMERSMIGVTKRDRIRSEDIRSITKVEDIIKKIRQLKWRWTGHMTRDSRIKWTKILTGGNHVIAQGKEAGRQKMDG
ncbi:Craniofacial development protein 2 [Eumeta japonica]|uniref:Craniofacial development protein 2 n=1 Tax=Eumeta variegata TaxID=151549 RepID=A0A4C1YX61_EUMVA|nr:Craniofacial development protein 2 [Eumeta japonica]